VGNAVGHVQGNLKTAFQGMDVNKDGEVQPAEAEGAIGRLLKAAGATAAEVAEVKTHAAEFVAMDVDGSGGISWDELPKEATDGTKMKQTLEQAGKFVDETVGPSVLKVLSLLDANGDGHVSPAEVGM